MKGILFYNHSKWAVFKCPVRKANLAGLLLLTFLALAPVQLFSQNKSVEKANQLFKYEQFAEAINLYEQALQETAAKKSSSKQSSLIKTKLAYCYRMTNKMDKAETLYADIVRDEKAKSETYLYYGEALMGNGKYEEAKKWFIDYSKLEPQDEQGRRLIEACNIIPFIQPYFQHIEIQEFPQNSPADDNAPVAWQNGVVFSSDRKQGLKLMKEKSGWTGRDYLDLYYAERTADNSFAEPKKFSSKLSEVNKNTGNASFTTDGNQVFFTRNDNELNKQNAYNLQLFRAEATGADRWKNVEKLSFCFPAYNFMHPAVSPDGQWLFFATNKPGGEGGTDLWVSKKNGKNWEKPENPGSAINTSANEGFPFMDAEGRLFFCSKGHPGYGGFDIFVSEKNETGKWTAPVNLGKPINSPLDDISIFVAPDGKGGMFTSSRDGGDDDIYLFSLKDTFASFPLAVAETISPENEQEKGKSKTSEEIAVTPPIKPTPIQEPGPIKTVNAPETPITPKAETAANPPKEEQPGFQIPPSIELNKTTDEKENPGAKPSIIAIEPVVSDTFDTARFGEADGSPPIVVPSFSDFEKRWNEGRVNVGERFRLPGATYDPNVWQLTPRITVVLDKLVGYLRNNPALEIEISAHTESLGSDEENLALTKNRAQIAIDYIIVEGISSKRLTAKGYGETLLLNRCHNGVPCNIEEHLYNQRLEMKVVKK